MARILAAGDALVITSALSMEDLRTIKKYKNEALTLYGGKDGDEPIFRIMVDSDTCFDKFGIGFDSETRDEKKSATRTFFLPRFTGDVKEFVADHFGAAINHLNALEATLPDVLETIKKEKAAIMAQVDTL